MAGDITEKFNVINDFYNYKISSLGNVLNIKTNKILKPRVRKDYLSVILYGKEIKTFNIHRLVAMAFIPNPCNKPQVNHINGIKTDNKVKNLEWVTASENQNHAFKIGLQKSRIGINHHSAKLKDSDIIDIRLNKKENLSNLSKKYNVSSSLISLIKLNKIWKHI